MQNTHVRRALARLMRALVLAWLIGAVAAAASGQSIVYVDDDAAPGGNGSSWGTAYNNLQSALDAAAVPGSGITEIHVGQGTYKPTAPQGGNPASATFKLMNGVTMKGGFAGIGEDDPDERDPDKFVSSLTANLGNGVFAYRVLNGDECDPTAVIDGFAVFGGMLNLTGSPSVIGCTFGDADNGAGGMGNATGSNTVVTNCTFMNHAGTVFTAFDNSNPVVTNCRFIGNQLTSRQVTGVVWYAYGSNPVLHGCLFEGNSSLNAPGCALFCNDCSYAELQDCEFSQNSSLAASGAFLGDQYGTSDIVIERCVFHDNFAEVAGAGLILNGNSALIRECRFSNNESGFVAGGAIIAATTSTVVNCTFNKNSAPEPGGGLEISGAMTSDIVNCTFYANQGSGFHRADSPLVTLTNCIFWANTPSQIANTAVIVSFSDVQGGWSGPGSNNIDLDPMFLQPGCDNLRLAYGSPCIDAGNNAYIPPGITSDLDGQERIQNAIVDMGAYEGGHDPLPPMACEDNLDQGYAVKLMPSGGAFNPPSAAAIFIENLSAPDNAWVTVTQIDAAQHPGAGGFNELGSILDVQTSIPDSQFFMRVYIPFNQSNLNGFDPLDADLTYFDSQSGDWQLAPLANTQNSPGHKGPIGDRIVTVGSSWNGIWTFELGDYGVFWNPSTQQGFVWANVDHASDFAFGIKLPQCSGDCAYPTNGTVNQDDLTTVINSWGLTPSGPASFADINHDGLVNVADLLAVLNGWGPCP